MNKKIVFGVLIVLMIGGGISVFLNNSGIGMEFFPEFTRFVVNDRIIIEKVYYSDGDGLFLNSGSITDFETDNTYFVIRDSEVLKQSYYFNNSLNIVDFPLYATIQKKSDNDFLIYELTNLDYSGITKNVYTNKHTYGRINIEFITLPSETIIYANGTLRATFTQKEIVYRLYDPTISFISPTPNNGTVQYLPNASILINTSISESELLSLKYYWNGTNYSIYDDSVVLKMNFDSFTGLNDTSVRSNNATNNGATYTANGRYNGAYYYDGNDYMSFSESKLSLPDNFTIQMWLKFGNYDSGTNYGILSDSTNANDGNSFMALRLTGNDGFFRYYGVTPNSGITLISSPVVGKWYHILITRYGGNAYAYVNGEFIGSVADTNTVDPTSDVRLGWWSWAGLGEYMLGDIDEFIIHNRSFTDEDVYISYVSNLAKYNSSQWYLLVNQSENVSDVLTVGNYTFNVFSYNGGYESEAGLRNVSIDYFPFNLSFVNPTPTDGFIQLMANPTVIINTTIINDGLINVSYIWNGTEYIIYDKKIKVFYNFDNVTSIGDNSTKVTDIINNEIDGILNNGASLINEGKYDGALNFDGIDDYVSFSTGDMTAFTYAVWVKPFEVGNGYQAIISSDPTVGRYPKISNNDGENHFNCHNGYAFNSIDSISLGNATLGKWQHYACVYNLTHLIAYRDGVLIGMQTRVDYFPHQSITTIGRYYTTTDNHYLNATIDEVRIWNKTLSEDEIKQQYFMNFKKYASNSYSLYVNQSKNATNNLSQGVYTYNITATNQNEFKSLGRTITLAEAIDTFSITLPVIYENMVYVINFDENETIYANTETSLNNHNVTGWRIVTDAVSISSYESMDNYYQNAKYLIGQELCPILNGTGAVYLISEGVGNMTTSINLSNKRLAGGMSDAFNIYSLMVRQCYNGGLIPYNETEELVPFEVS